MPIAVDAMGGDYAPEEVVKGAVAAAREGIPMVLVGQQAVLEPLLAELKGQLPVVHAPQVIGFHEQPTQAVQAKPDSSIVVGISLLQQGKASAFVSAGHSGAVVAASLFILGREEDIERPALCVLYPTPQERPVLVLDVGATVDCRPSYLVQFAHMGSVYMEKVLGIARPRIGLLSTGEEEIKGNRLVREAHPLLKEAGLNFVGNVEAKDILRDKAEVIVTDGFTGNVVIKGAEGFAEVMVQQVSQALGKRKRFQSALRLFRRAVDYSEFGGAPLLGVRGNVIVAHGRSQAPAIKSAIRLAYQAAERGF
ncbi:MAG TPA: phosphate acyltransferase PlsX [Dehalococcoidia bacterium]|nr:phosphate acyltransferase PlsX [Dehalococcoidia bacterium]